MQLRNDQGTGIDAVPFLVVAALGFLVLYSSAPGYLLELGLGIEEALVVTTVLFGCTVVVAYHRLVWKARPALRSEVPVGVRLHRLFYSVLIGLGLSLLLLLAPLVR